jgi:hypothetical protein
VGQKLAYVYFEEAPGPRSATNLPTKNEAGIAQPRDKGRTNLPQDDPRQRRPDISKANDILKWTPKTKLAEGLNKTIEYFENLLSDNAVRASIIHERRREKRWFARNHSGAADRGRGSLGAI